VPATQSRAGYSDPVAHAQDSRHTTLKVKSSSPGGHGRVIENPISGERIVIQKTGADTDGTVLAFDLFLPPGGHVPAGHVHPEQEERFTVVSGEMRFRLGGRDLMAGPGDTVVITAGQPHWFGNSGSEVSHAQVEVRPALRMEEMFEATEAISLAGHFPGTRLPRLSDLALVLLEFRRELAVPNLPPSVVTAVLSPLAWWARLRGRGSRRSPGS
jgi:quercetin dioxygenase-like cupin family protein